ncbi:MAG: DedA family protein [Methylococcaceae bacterium]|nr:DedA family protein [Methylococcaceae bacterium]
MSLEELIIQYGYLALFIGTFLEGETILLIAGFLAHEGYLNLPLTILSAFLGTFAGDQTFFYLGRFKGVHFLEKRPTWKHKAEKAFRLLDRHQIAIILGFRFLYGIRNVTPFVIGASGLRPIRFFILNFLGALVWAISFGLIGFQVGTLLETYLQQVKQYEMLILGVFCGIALLYFIWTNLKKDEP